MGIQQLTGNFVIGAAVGLAGGEDGAGSGRCGYAIGRRHEQRGGGVRRQAELVDRWHGQKPLTLPGVRVERTGEKITLKTTKTPKPGAC